jgi:hypothetical protein
MPDRRRAAKTIMKIRNGGVAAPTHDPPRQQLGNGFPCDGCDETIVPTDPMYVVNVRGVLQLHFHDSCYEAWSAFRP